MLDKIDFLNKNLKYKHCKSLIGQEIELKLDNKDDINNSIKNFILKELNIDIDVTVSIPGIAKLGIIDLRLVLKNNIEYPKISGLEILKENNLIDNKEINCDYDDILIEQIKENENYLRIFISAKNIQRGVWYKENKIEFLDFIKNGVYRPKKENINTTFEIKDACITNCKSIWFQKFMYV